MSGEIRSYHGRPILKPPAWTWEVPWYLFSGGLAGASSVLAAAARASGNPRLARSATLVAAPAALVSPALLVSDLGRPERFLNMLRVFRPTSAMSMGAWLLAAYAPLAVGAGLAEVLPLPPRLGRLAGAGAAALGPGMATYTAVLVADTVVPAWHEARDELPFVFAGGAASTAGAAALLLTPEPDAAPARRVAVAGALVELAALEVLDRRIGLAGEPYRTGEAGRLAKAAKGLTAAGAVLTALGARRRPVGLAGAVLLLAGGACERWAVYRAGFASTADPRYVVGPQRERLGL